MAGIRDIKNFKPVEYIDDLNNYGRDSVFFKGDLEDREFKRASQFCVCKICGHNYLKHPEDKKEPWLNVLCDGSLVKL